MASKIRLQAATDDELVKKCQDETKCGDCNPPVWMTPSHNTRMNPPENTVVVIVDVRSNQGAIQIADKQSNEYVDGVGTEAAGSLVMIPWKQDWWYYCMGSTRLAYIGRKT